MDSLNRHEDYGQESLEEGQLLEDPIKQFQSWLVEAEQAGIYEPNAFVLGTVDASNQPRSRTVLLKGLDERGFFFASNYLSRKGEALELNNKVSAVFGWYSMYRQILVQGIAEKVAASESDEYHASRPHDSQVAAWSSKQSSPIKSRQSLDAQFDEALGRFEGKDVPRPDFWGGYRIIPSRIEFWKGRSNRMHDRIEFSRALGLDGSHGAWVIGRLQP